MKPALDAAQREQRKLDLLLASRLARAQAALAVDQLAARAEQVTARVAQLRAFVARPSVQLVGAASVALWFGRSLGRRRAPVARRAAWGSRLLRWGWLGWRAWRIGGPALLRLLGRH